MSTNNDTPGNSFVAHSGNDFPPRTGTPTPTETPEKVADATPAIAEVLPIAGTVRVASSPDDEATNALTLAAVRFIELYASMTTSKDASVVSEDWYEEAPTLRGPGQWYEGCAALCMAAFGKKVVPNVDEGTTGALAQMALQIAHVYMSEPMNSPTQHAMETLALVARRRQQLETRHKARRTLAQRRKRPA